MRWIYWVSALSFLLLFQSTIADAGCSSCIGNDGGSYRAYRGGACFSPPGYSLAPGCCVCPPSACDNAWDGYCEEKARWQAYFTQVGTPRLHYCGCSSIVPVTTSCNSSKNPPAVETQPKPAVEPQPKPAVKSQPASPPVLSPGQATRNLTNSWFR